MILDLEIYPCKIVFCIGDKEKAKVLLDVVPEEEINDFLNTDTLGLTSRFSSGDCAIYIEKLPETSFELSVLAHEIFHAAMFVLEYFGIEYCSESNEAFAYLVGYITKKFFKFYNVKVTYEQN